MHTLTRWQLRQISYTCSTAFQERFKMTSAANSASLSSGILVTFTQCYGSQEISCQCNRKKDRESLQDLPPEVLHFHRFVTWKTYQAHICDSSLFQDLGNADWPGKAKYLDTG